ncbi:hemerythrin domain-containing protein [Streptomyces sp. NBC_00820]|uniref:hemerythrin domain-containing protein n=1 Tax=Streptomyces sp. NBC_00820 TaxID=2975842 RepID=UPI002ED0DFDC|nr:hemerythrin domain-containing protein [Streptomyces sp. NBC_00820]
MGHGGNVIDELVTDHQEVEEIFRRIAALPPGDKERKTYADLATMELIRHCVAEEEYLSPAVRDYVANGGALADEELKDHARAEQIMEDLASHEAVEAQFDRLISVVIIEIRAHMADEEGRLFPRLRAACSEDTLDELGDKARRAKEAALIRSHPSAPGASPGNKLLAPDTGPIDRMLCALTGRGKQD